MLQYLFKRILLALLTLLVILFVSYLLIRLAPGDPTRSSFLGEGGEASSNLSGDKAAFTVNKSLREKLHLDKNPILGFLYWMKGVILKFDFGESATVDRGRPVVKVIMERLPITLKLNIIATLLIYFFAIPIGIHSAVFSDTKMDKILTFFLFLLYSLPGFWTALILQALFCDGGYFPVFPLKWQNIGTEWGKSIFLIIFDDLLRYVLPVFCLSYAGFAGLSRFARSSMLEVIKKDYIKTARAKGLPERIVIFKHAFRNALITMITLFAGLLPGLVAGSIFVEYVFNIPGMGYLSMMALSSRDIPLVMAIFAFGSFLTLAGIIISDILYVFADPRINFEQR
ncbi:MAG TPA: ABC transporter permease [Victivallales bacterium]|nr:ABC transporter permease [Victivallales bacterium]HPO90008.1 ABC transporter permease [Victivallales bacterium]HRR29507.1 ABC transporter permease [Victivallales bacterium]HRU00347.1 ABC transporter permease [Victivallales bacterium]